MSLRKNYVPREWRKATISAIYKKGSKKSANNYRPVSLTSIICKLMEKIIRNFITDHMTANKYFSKKQFGFMKGRSTMLQLLKTLAIWTEAIDNGNNIDVIYMDFMKAFNTVPHRRLMKKIQAYNINTNITAWINSFLQGRIQQVYVNGVTSQWKNVTSGIPQGSVLGPLLFVIYINDLPEHLNSECYLFADDTKLFKIITEADDQKLLQEDLNKCMTWSSKWLLKFHPEKCKQMTIGTIECRLPFDKRERFTVKTSTNQNVYKHIVKTSMDFQTKRLQRLYGPLC